MRTFVFALCLALPASGIAGASATHSNNPLRFFHRAASSSPARAKPQWVQLRFRNATLRDAELQVGKDRFRVKAWSEMRVRVTSGAVVRRVDDSNSRHDGEIVMQVRPADEGRLVQIG